MPQGVAAGLVQHDGPAATPVREKVQTQGNSGNSMCGLEEMGQDSPGCVYSKYV